MANTTFYNRGDVYHDSAGNPAIIKRGNELTFTEHFNAGGGSELAPATANTLGGVKVGNGLNIASDGTLSVAGVDYSTTEVLTGRKWIDGKDIYEKVIVFANPVFISTEWTDTPESITGYDTIVNCHGNTNNGSFYLVDCVKGTTYLQLQRYEGGNVKTIILEYTKSTTPTLTTTRTSKKKG